MKGFGETRRGVKEGRRCDENSGDDYSPRGYGLEEWPGHCLLSEYIKDALGSALPINPYSIPIFCPQKGEEKESQSSKVSGDSFSLSIPLLLEDIRGIGT
jgi:hypothetical protein